MVLTQLLSNIILEYLFNQDIIKANIQDIFLHKECTLQKELLDIFHHLEVMIYLELWMQNILEKDLKQEQAH